MKIAEIRALTGLSQARFGAKYGIPKRTLQDWETGKHRVPQYIEDMLERIVKEDIDAERDGE